ncbi:hypothetical protein Hanom_Chr06g00538981 [Helianthus anomalus]
MFKPLLDHLDLEIFHTSQKVQFLKKLQKRVEDVLVEKKKLEKKLEKRVKTVEAENSSLLKKVEADQVDIHILKALVAELEEEKSRRDEQYKNFELKNKELEANNARREHEDYMLKKVIEDLIGKLVEQRFEEIQLEEVRAKRKAEMEAQMKDKGKGVECEKVVEMLEREMVVSVPTEDPVSSVLPISSVSGSTCIKVTEASTEENVDDYLQDDANEEPENAGSEGEHVDDKSVDESEKLILRLEPDVEEGEFRHSYTLAEIIKLTHIDENEFKFDFEEELNEFDINQQHEYDYKYVEDADNYDRVEVEDCSDEEKFENVHGDTSNFPTLAEFFSQANEDELRRKVEECVKNKSFDEMSKEERREERKKWLNSNDR